MPSSSTAVCSIRGKGREKLWIAALYFYGKKIYFTTSGMNSSEAKLAVQCPMMQVQFNHALNV
jgi:hypothetical protein